MNIIRQFIKTLDPNKNVFVGFKYDEFDTITLRYEYKKISDTVYEINNIIFIEECVGGSSATETRFNYVIDITNLNKNTLQNIRLYDKYGDGLNITFFSALESLFF